MLMNLRVDNIQISFISATSVYQVKSNNLVYGKGYRKEVFAS